MIISRHNLKAWDRRLSILLLGLTLVLPAWAQPRHLYLTWDNPDTAHTQTVVFQTLDRAQKPRVELSVQGKNKSFPAKTVMFSGLTRRVHHVTLSGLSPATTYRFRAGDDRYGFSGWKTFKTLPTDDAPLKVLSGGDMYRHQETVDLLKAGSTLNPDVALVGGDIAYADGDLQKIGFWDDWFDNWTRYLDGPSGRLVPMICAIGNHEVQGMFGRTPAQAPFYFGLFPQGGKPYFSRRLGQDMDLVVLDTGHVTSFEAQVPFLEEALKTSTARFKVALYHVALYPSHRSYEESYSVFGRRHWVPLFDKYGLDLAFENHDHVFKRSHPLKANKIDPTGTVYLGEGCWGRTARRVMGDRWYNVKALPKEHFWYMQNRPAGLFCQAIDKFGKVFDETTIKK